MSDNRQFFNPYRHNFIRAAIAIPEVRVADPAFNTQQTIDLMHKAAAEHAVLALFPELGLSAYSCEDLFQQQALLDACLDGLARIVEASRAIAVITLVGLPLVVDNGLYNCCAVIYRGSILGVVPKTYLPNYREFYEMRQFAPGTTAVRQAIDLLGQQGIPFGGRLLFQAENQPLLTFFVEICEDMWVPIPPSSYAALAGAPILLNLSASNITIGKDEYRRQLSANQSARCLAAYLYSAAGYGESTTDLAWDGHGMIFENGSLLAESQRWAYGPQMVVSDIDLDRLIQERIRQTTFNQQVRNSQAEINLFRTVRFTVDLPDREPLALVRRYERFPYVPSDPATRHQRCEEVYQIQVHGLVKRLRAMGADKVVIGISGGLDSTQALLVCARAMDIMGLQRDHIYAYTMPGFATSERTLAQARQLMAAVGCRAHEIDIRPSCMQMLKDIGHPFAAGQPVHDVTFENVQAGERTSHLFRLANLYNAPVIGTGDLSEIALGWSTYGVGDQMSHYNVNASVPKTLIQYLIRWIAETGAMGEQATQVLNAILATEISPELVPGNAAGQPGQRSEEIVGPYELQDFNLYYILRYGYSPQKVAYLAWNAWHDRNVGRWPGIPDRERHEYDIATIKRWLKVFLWRFFKTSQFKRTAMPNAPKVGSGGSLSPRGDWRAPSDGEATPWLDELADIPERGPEDA